MLTVSFAFAVRHDLLAQIDGEGIKLGLRKGAGMAHNDERVAVVGRLIRRMNVAGEELLMGASFKSLCGERRRHP